LIYRVEEAFSAAECDAIVALRTEALVRPAPVWGGAGYVEDARVRQASTCYRARGAETAWLFERLDALFAEAGAALDCPVAPLAEPVQVLRYEVGGHYQVWHTDAGADLDRERRISVSVELSAPEEHDGGDLEIAPDGMGGREGLPRGGARFFLSRSLHRVVPVTRGVRHALVAWAPAG
jgi:PKHD-type hydroxylase